MSQNANKPGNGVLTNVIGVVVGIILALVAIMGILVPSQEGAKQAQVNSEVINYNS